MSDRPFPEPQTRTVKATDDGFPSLAYVIGKLLFFTFLMIVCPLGSYYLAFNRDLDSRFLNWMY